MRSLICSNFRVSKWSQCVANKFLLAAVFVAWCGLASLAGAATAIPLASFNTSTVGQQVDSPLVFGNDGNLYGMTHAFGPQGHGTVFKVDLSNNNALSAVAVFNNTIGADPYAGLLVDSSGNMFGTTYDGGASSGGTIFKLDASNNLALTTLYNFTYNTTAPNEPRGNFSMDSAGNLYSTTVEGGPTAGTSYGTVFKLSAGSYTYSQVANFTLASGVYPYAGVTLDAAGNIYGTTEAGGAGGQGTLYKIATGGSTPVALATFAGSSNGGRPYGPPIIGPDGNLYGTTNQGGANNGGVLYRYNLTTNTLTTLINFNATTGFTPSPDLLMDRAGNIYGTTNFSGPSPADGLAFKLDATNNYAFTSLATFPGNASGAAPTNGLVADASGNLYGATISGGSGQAGIVYKIVGAGFVSAGDFNLDGHVNATDIAAMEQALTNLSAFEQSHGNLADWQVKSIGDVNGDGKFNNADLQYLLTTLKNGGGSADPVPEPASWVLAFLALAIVSGTRFCVRCVR